jgi:preprotein translocase subunit SecB
VNAQHDRNSEESLSFFPVQMIRVRLYNIHIGHRDFDPETDEQLPLKVRLVQDDSPPEAKQFGLLLRFETFFSPDDGDKGYFISLAIEGFFEAIVDIETIKPEIIERFKSRDAILLLWPYLRQTLQDITIRMSLDMPILPILDARALLASPEEEAITGEESIS